MKYLILLLTLIIAGCSEKKPETKKVSLHLCETLSQKLKGNFSHSKKGCTIFIEKSEYVFGSDDKIHGVMFGLGMAVNRPKIKKFYECIEKEEVKYEYTNFEIDVVIDRNCRKKLGMVDYF